MKLTVETLNAKVPQTIVLDVELDSSVLYVKFMIQDRSNIAFDNQMLLADGQVLSNSLRLIDYDFIGDRTTNLLLIEEYLSRFLLDDNFNVTIKTLTGKTTELQVRSGARVEALKVKYREKEGLQVYDQYLIFNGKQLEGGRQLAYYDIREGSVLHLVSRLGGSPRPRYCLQFRTLTGKTISMSGTDETVQTVIERVWKLEGIRAGNELLFNNEPLDSERRIATRTHAHYEKYHEQYYLDAYKFEQGTILTFRDKSSARAKDELPVYVKFPGSETRKALTLIVKAVHSVRSLKSAIGSKAGGRVENLKLAGDDRELEDDHKLSDYAVRHETVLHATLKLKLFVKRLDNGTIFRLEVDSRDRIENVKERIHHHEHIPTDMQVLSLKTRFETRRLEDDELAEEACFEGERNPPVLGLEVKLVRDLQIVINPDPWLLELEASGIRRPISLSIKSNETIRGVKSRIAKQINSSADQQHLYFNGEQLVDNCTFDQLGVWNRVGLSFALRSNTFKISIVPIGTGQSKFEVEVYAYDTIKYLKWKLEQRFHWFYTNRCDLPSDQQILIYEGKALEDDRTLLNYRIGAGSELSVSLRVVELEITVQTEFVDRRVLKVRSDSTWEMFVSEIKKLGLTICSENDCSVSDYTPRGLNELVAREPVMIKQTAYCNKCPGCARIKAFKQVTGWE